MKTILKILLIGLLAFEFSSAQTTQIYKKRNSAQGGIDANTVSMLHFDGTNAATVFIDEIGNIVTPYGNAKTSTGQKKFGTASGLFDGTGDYLTVPGSFSMGTGSFTIDLQVYFSAIVTYQWLIGDYAELDNNLDIVYFGSTNLLYVYLQAVSYTFSWTPTTGAWYHVAVTRSGTDLKVFIDGSQIGVTKTSSNNIVCTSLIIGGQFNGTYTLNGYIDELRVSNTARWTTNFPPPPYPYSR
jgi:hypothetical protein